ncbi:DUF2613 domain-containing protein [Rhizobium jaguaris]|uniref:BA14K family protein n=1 Tax=Rhizobium jaguaris TaxID=1312183 RepID=A0A387FVK8_9HYPH|nr:DUF2613 domain-containing protein [Rhizobium jaguaris]AYG58966.1 hypothetical protein CCGE525_09255 [Rhizobium jaguaris]
MRHIASIVLAASLTIGTVLAAVVPATALPLTNSPSPSSSGVIQVQEHGSRRDPNWDYGRREYWRDRHYHGRYWRDNRWDRRRYWDDDWRYRNRYYRPHHGGIYFEIRP